VTLRALERRRQALVARSTVQRERIQALLSPVAAKLLVADRLVAALRSALAWGVRLLPVYSLLRRLSR
jgi:hypothetical protein